MSRPKIMAIIISLSLIAGLLILGLLLFWLIKGQVGTPNNNQSQLKNILLNLQKTPLIKVGNSNDNCSYQSVYEVAINGRTQDETVKLVKASITKSFIALNWQLVTESGQSSWPVFIFKQGQQQVKTSLSATADKVLATVVYWWPPCVNQ